MVPFGTGRCQTLRRLTPVLGGDTSRPRPYTEGGGDVNVVTYEELFQLLLVLISFAGLIITIIKKK